MPHRSHFTSRVGGIVQAKPVEILFISWHGLRPSINPTVHNFRRILEAPLKKLGILVFLMLTQQVVGLAAFTITGPSVFFKRPTVGNRCTCVHIFCLRD